MDRRNRERGLQCCDAAVQQLVIAVIRIERGRALSSVYVGEFVMIVIGVVLVLRVRVVMIVIDTVHVCRQRAVHADVHAGHQLEAQHPEQRAPQRERAAGGVVELGRALHGNRSIHNMDRRRRYAGPRRGDHPRTRSAAMNAAYPGVPST